MKRTSLRPRLIIITADGRGVRETRGCSDARRLVIPLWTDLATGRRPCTTTGRGSAGPPLRREPARSAPVASDRLTL